MMRARSYLVAQRSFAVLAAIFFVMASMVFADQVALGALAKGSLDQCGNGPLSAPTTCAPTAWQNGNLNAQQAHYFEGDSVPYRLGFLNLSTTGTHSVTIQWDTTKSGKHALDYLTSFNRTVSTADPCAGVSGCSGPASTLGIPADPNVTGLGVTPIAGNFSLYGGTIASATAYTLTGTYAGDSSTAITLSFTTTVANPVLAWGGHIATRLDWGSGNSAVAITGSPYHMRLLDIDGSGGNQDRSLSSDAVIFPSSVNIVKSTSSGDGQFGFTSTTSGTGTGSPTLPASFTIQTASTAGHLLTSGILVPSGTATITVTENDPSPDYLLTTIACSDADSTTSLATRTATIKVSEGENVTCTFTNTLQRAALTLDKIVTNDNGGTAAESLWNLTATGASSNPTNLSGPGAAGHTDVVSGSTFKPDTYTLAETGTVSGYTNGTTYRCVKNGGAPVLSNTITLASGDTAVCTITNNDNPPSLTLDKIVSNDNGGTAAESSWTLAATGTGVSPTNLSGPGAAGHTDVVSGSTFKADTYTLAETGTVSGYTNGTTYSCVKTPAGGVAGAPVVSNTITLGNGDSAVCTITNNDNPPSLTLDKVVSNDNGGTAAESLWNLTATGASSNPTNLSGPGAAGHTDVVSGSTFKADTYTLAETGSVTGYTNGTTYSCVKTPAGGVAGAPASSNTITLANGDSAVCTITNNDNPPSLTLDKIVTNPNGTTFAPESSWTLTATGTGVSPTNLSGPGAAGHTDVVSGSTFKADTYTLAETGTVSGYTNGTTYSCVKNGGAPVVSNTITLANGDSAICTITNSDTKASPTLKTAQGWELFDTATFTGIRPGAPDEATTVTFKLWSTNTCDDASGPLGTRVETISGGGTATTSTGITVTPTTSPTTYYWTADYAGDSFNNPAHSTCGTETTTITFVQPTP